MRKFNEYRPLRFWAFLLGSSAVGGILIASLGRIVGVSFYETYSGIPGYFLTGLWIVGVLRTIDAYDGWFVRSTHSSAECVDLESKIRRFCARRSAQRAGVLILSTFIVGYLAVITYLQLSNLARPRSILMVGIVWIIGIIALALLSRAWRRDPLTRG